MKLVKGSKSIFTWAVTGCEELLFVYVQTTWPKHIEAFVCFRLQQPVLIKMSVFLF